MSCGEPAWWHEIIGLDEEPVSKDYVDNGAVMPNCTADIGAGDLLVSPTYIQTINTLDISGDGIVWRTPEGDTNVTDELKKLREEVNMLKGFIDDFMGTYRVKEFNLFGVSLVKEGGHPIQESEEEKYERAMKGL